MRGITALLLAAASPTLSVDNPALALDRSFPRATPGAIRALYNDAPQIPFTNFSAAYVKAALATPTDWRTKGAVTPAKNQGPHGYCGTFGRCGEMEGGWVIKGGKPLTNFSEEMLVDCIGWDQDQFSFFNPKGHMTSEDYPYNLSHYPDSDPPVPGNPCKYDASKVVKGTEQFFTFSTGRAPDEEQMAAFIHHNGPVSAGIGSDVFSLREKGCEARGDCFINATACATQNSIDHSITVVGYGTDPVKGDYWIIKNSWSEKFANNGFINVQRGVQCGGMCGDPTICGNVFGHGDPKGYFE